MTHQEIQQLLGAFALDAVDPAESTLVETHLATCPRCRDEVREHREVASLLAYAGMAAPEGSWERLAASLDAPPPALAAPALGRGRRQSGRRRGLGVAAAVATASVFLGLGAAGGVQVQSALRSQDAQIENLRVASSKDRLLGEAAAAALTDGARSAHLLTPGNVTMADAVLLADGTGYLIDKGAPALPGERTYQLWAVAGGQKLSVGVLGADVDVATFRAPEGTDALALTVEQMPGVVASQNQAVGYGLVKASTRVAPRS